MRVTVRIKKPKCVKCVAWHKQVLSKYESCGGPPGCPPHPSSSLSRFSPPGCKHGSLCKSHAKGRPAELCPRNPLGPLSPSARVTAPHSKPGHTLLGRAVTQLLINCQPMKVFNPVRPTQQVPTQGQETRWVGGLHSLRGEARGGPASKDAMKCPPPQESPCLQARCQGCTDSLEALTYLIQSRTHSQPQPRAHKCTHDILHPRLQGPGHCI